MDRREFCQRSLTVAAAVAAPSLAEAQSAAPRDLGSALEPIRQRHGLPALAAVVVQRGQTVGLGATGFRKDGDPTRVTAEDRFHLGSCSKALTGTLLAAVMAEGKLQPSSTVASVLPELVPTIHPQFTRVPLEQFLWHRSGMRFKWPDGDMRRLPGSPIQQRLRFVQLMMQTQPEAAPGEKYIYSHGYTVGAAMAERLTGKSWEELIAERVFRPLGMASAGFGSMGRPGAIEQPWQHSWRVGKRVPVEPGPLADNPPVGAPSGAVHCSLGDWAKFLALHAAGNSRVVGAAGLQWLHTPSPAGDYAIGWSVTQRGWGGGTVLTHSGSNTMNYCVAWVAPLRRFAVGIATNDGAEDAGKACDEAAGLLVGAYASGGTLRG